MMKQFAKIAALCAVVAMMCVLLGQDANAADVNIYWQKQSVGKTVYWVLNSNGKLTNGTKNNGWGYIPEDEDFTLGSSWRAMLIHDVPQAGSTYKRQILFHNLANGKVVYWQLNSNGRLLNRTRGEGWGYVREDAMSTDWSMIQILDSSLVKDGNGGMDRLLWFRSSNGKVVYWNLNSNGVLLNNTQDNGWGYIDDEKVLSGWRMIEAREFDNSNYAN